MLSVEESVGYRNSLYTKFVHRHICPNRATNLCLKSGLIFNFNFDFSILHQLLKTSNTAIDIVYLWVNGNDSEWRAKRQKYFQKLEASGSLDFAKFGNVEGRYRDNDELRFSLRALEKFFPDHGHIFIVTDGQVPDWYQASDQITLIDHHELIPHSSLPTFDSGNIESYIHHIPLDLQHRH